MLTLCGCHWQRALVAYWKAWQVGFYWRAESFSVESRCVEKDCSGMSNIRLCRLCAAYHIYIIVFERSHRHQKQVPWPLFLHLMSSVLYFKFNFLHLNAVLASQPFDIELGVTEIGREPNVYIYCVLIIVKVFLSLRNLEMILQFFLGSHICA